MTSGIFDLFKKNKRIIFNKSMLKSQELKLCQNINKHCHNLCQILNLSNRL